MTPFQVPVSKLDFDLQNPRFPPQASQRDALEKILLTYPSKTTKLAEHIIAHGQNPIEMLAVYETEARRYVVLEGNRRTAVLKVLNKPALLDSLPPGTGVPAFVKKMKLLAAKASKEAIGKITVVAFPDRDEAAVWIELKHTGENEGAGIVEWDGTQRARYRKGDIGLSLLDFGKSNGWFTEDELTARAPFPITTFNRLVGDTAVRSALGLQYSGGKLSSLVPVEALGKAITRVVRDLASGDLKVSHLMKKADRQNYIDQLPKSVLPKIPAESIPWPVDMDAIPAEVAASPKARIVDRKLTRKALIPASFSIKTNEASPRLNYIYRELKALAVQTNKNAVAVLLRVFIELSLDDFLVRENVTMIRKDAKRTTLADKAISVAAYLKGKGRMNKGQEDIVHRLVGDGDAPRSEVASITTLHSFVHNRHASPLPSELLTIWENISDFMRLITHVDK